MFFVAKICKSALRASIEGYLVVAASTPTYSSLVKVEADEVGGEVGQVGQVEAAAGDVHLKHLRAGIARKF